MILALLWLVGFILTSSSPVFPHGGGLDSYGCHRDKKQGNYHCHRVILSRLESFEELNVLFLFDPTALVGSSRSFLDESEIANRRDWNR